MAVTGEAGTRVGLVEDCPVREPLLLTHITQCERRLQEIYERTLRLFEQYSAVLMPSCPKDSPNKEGKLQKTMPPAIECLQRLESKMEAVCELLEDFSRRGEA